MGKKKNIARRRKQKENDDFDLIELGDDVQVTAAKNEPRTIPGLSNKSKKKKGKKNRFQLKPSALSDIAMEEVVSSKKESKTISQGWHKVTLSNASKFDKDVILSCLSNACQAFTPVCFVKNNADYTFHVESPSAASTIKSLDRKISVTHNFLLRIKVAPSPPPKHFLDDEIKQKIKTVMGNRYNVSTKSLDMKMFHNDRLFIGDSAYVPLSRSNVMNNVLRIIGENVPDIEAIDFSANKLPSLDHFTMLEDNAIHLMHLDLSNNRLSDPRELEKLKHLKELRVLDLRSNAALVAKFKDKDDYVKKVHDILPKLKILDGQELPQRYFFEEQETLPPLSKLMSVEENGKKVMLEFVKQYVQVYDEDQREKLIDAYHPSALFSLSSAYPSGTTAHGSSKLSQYQMDSRNLNLLLQPSKRFSSLKKGREQVIKFLCDLPKTRHDLASFTLDIPIANQHLISVSLSGLFQEKPSESLRHFQRFWLLIPCGSGFVIINDSLYITNPTALQSKNAFSEEKSAQNEAVLPALQPQQMQTMVQELSIRTNLRPDWATKCLEESNWNLDLAVAQFQIAQNAGKIPQNAYAFISS